MWKSLKLLIPVGVAIVVAGAVFLVYISRAPVIVVADVSFTSLYGRARSEAVLSSVSLFRPVRLVAMADDAGSDLVVFAVAEESQKPYCVVFPLRFAEAARYYAQRYPSTPVIINEGRIADESLRPGNMPEGVITVQTDTEADFYRAGVLASIMNREKNGKVVVFLEPDLAGLANGAFLRGFGAQGNSPVFYTSFAQLDNFNGLSCVVLAGSGAEFLQNNKGIPVIFFTWLDPAYTPAEVAVIFDDSPLAQLISSVKMVSARENYKKIPSRVLIFSSRIADIGLLRSLREAAKNGN